MEIKTPLLSIFDKIFITASCTVPFGDDWLWWTMDNESRGTAIKSKVYHVFSINYVERSDKIVGIEIFVLPLNVIIAWNRR